MRGFVALVRDTDALPGLWCILVGDFQGFALLVIYGRPPGALMIVGSAYQGFAPLANYGRPFGATMLADVTSLVPDLAKSCYPSVE